MAQEHTPAAAPAPVAAKHAKIKPENNACLAKLNTLAIAFSTFYGFTVIIAAIAAFTKKWNFYVPYIGDFLSNTNQTSSLLITAIAALAFGIFGIITTNKLRDIETVKKSWAVVSKVFLVMAIIFAVEMLATMIYSLLGVGKRSGVSQGSLWLSGFLSQLIAGGAACGMFFGAKAIASGKVNVIKVLSVVGLCLASVALVLVIIQQCVSFYSKKSAWDYASDKLDSIIDNLYGK